MSIPAMTNYATGDMAALLLLYADMNVGNQWQAFGDFHDYLISTYILPIAYNAHPNSGVTSARSARDSAIAALAAALSPSVTGAVGFSVSSTLPSSTAHGTTTTTSTTVTVTFLSGYSGTVTWSLVSYSPVNITGVFSPTTNSASGTTALTITIDASVPAGSYSLYVIGTDAAGVSNSFGMTQIVT